ncbi:MAG: CPBP family intramembrane glutamic endopeptidase, partial [Clostridia bacterium]
SVLFTLFHFSFEKLLGIFFLSVVIGYVVYVTKSIFIGMIAHFVNNAAAMVISYAATRIGGSEWMYESTELVVEGFEVFQTIVSVVFIGAIVIGAASLTIGLMTVLTRRNRTEEEVLPRPRFMPADVFTFIPGLLLMAGIYSVTFLAMLFSQFLP